MSEKAENYVQGHMYSITEPADILMNCLFHLSNEDLKGKHQLMKCDMLFDNFQTNRTHQAEYLST